MGKSKLYYQHNLLREHSNKLPAVTFPDITLKRLAYINENSDAIYLYIYTKHHWESLNEGV